MENLNTAIEILKGNTSLGIEFGSTRIKAVLIDKNHTPIASGSHTWENRFENGLWTYSLEDIWTGLQDCYADMAKDVLNKYGVVIKKIGSIGFSAMMHGYMVFDENDEMLVPFRTWRNNNAADAARRLTEVFNYHIPARWSIAHLYQAVLNGEEHVSKIRFQTTLEGYIHWQLTGEKVLGIGEASGMFPIDIKTKQYNVTMLKQFQSLVKDKNYPWTVKDIFPKILLAGENAGYLTEKGAKLLDVSGNLEAGVPFAPPEGDAGTGMTATNSIKKRTGNVSAGTSIFGMVVLEEDLKKVHDELDLVTTPMGDLVGMVHCNNCTSDINAWVNMFGEFARATGVNLSGNELYGLLYNKALEGDPDCGGVIAYNYFSGEHITYVDEGRPMVVRSTESTFNLANLMRSHLYSTMATLKVGLDIMLKEEGVKLDSILGHGGLFKTKGVGQGFLAAAINAPVSVMETAGEGGAWGMAILASYLINKEEGESLADYLDNKVFADMKKETMDPDPVAVEGFNRYIERYKAGLNVERCAVTALK